MISNLAIYASVLVALITSTTAFATALTVAARNARTSKEVERLKASSAEGIEHTRGRLAHQAAVALANRKSNLERVNLQLKQLYGPLYAIAHGSHRAWTTFRSMHGPKGPYWGEGVQTSEADSHAWRLWMTTVFMPLNLEMERLVLSNIDLLYGEQMEDCLIDLCAHVEAYKTILERWKAEDFSAHVTPVDFPGDALRKYTENCFTKLRREQRSLLCDVYGGSEGGES